MARFKFYAVRRGRTTDVFDKWYGIGGAEEAIEDYPGAEFKGFHSREEAEAWLRGEPSLTRQYDALITKALAGDRFALRRAASLLRKNHR